MPKYGREESEGNIRTRHREIKCLTHYLFPSCLLAQSGEVVGGAVLVCEIRVATETVDFIQNSEKCCENYYLDFY